MNTDKKEGRYKRIINQLTDLMEKSKDINARMCSVAAILHYKMPNFFWTGFYLLKNNEQLIVSTYQGPIACMELAKNKGVCWDAINKRQSIVVPNVEEYSGHIACDSRSKSEIVIPVIDKQNTLIGVLDIDSDKLNCFDETDAQYLQKIVQLLFI